jgi:hypothetical protein
MQQTTVEEKEKDYTSIFSGEREEWREKIRILSVRSKNIRELADVQVELYSSRQILLEYAYKLGQILIKLNSRYRKERGERLKYYSEMTQVKYGSNEKTPLIESDLAELKEKIDLVDNHMSYMNETIKTVDHFLFGIKSRISLETFMRGGQ